MPVPVTFRISETIAPPFPNKQPTWLCGTTILAFTVDPLFEPESIPFSMPASIDLEKTRTTAFCAGEYRESGFYTRQPTIKPINNLITNTPINKDR